jgi:hypothetical protein
MKLPNLGIVVPITAATSIGLLSGPARKFVRG